MEQEKKFKRYLVTSIVCSTWFIATGWIWTYYVNLVISFPIALLGFWLWRKGSATAKFRILNATAMTMLIIGGSISAAALLILTMFN